MYSDLFALKTEDKDEHHYRMNISLKEVDTQRVSISSFKKSNGVSWAQLLNIIKCQGGL